MQQERREREREREKEREQRNNKMAGYTPWRILVKTPTRQHGQDQVHNISHLPNEIAL